MKEIHYKIILWIIIVFAYYGLGEATGHFAVFLRKVIK